MGFFGDNSFKICILLELHNTKVIILIIIYQNLVVNINSYLTLIINIFIYIS